jgi:hypothetical protein
MPKFRNGSRTIDAWQEASGDWLVMDMKAVEIWPEEDRIFRERWEPADQEAVRMWAGEEERIVVPQN